MKWKRAAVLGLASLVVGASGWLFSSLWKAQTQKEKPALAKIVSKDQLRAPAPAAKPRPPQASAVPQPKPIAPIEEVAKAPPKPRSVPAAPIERPEVRLVYPHAGEALQTGDDQVEVRFFWQSQLKPPFLLEVAENPAISAPSVAVKVDGFHDLRRFTRPKNEESLALYWRVIHPASQTKSKAQKLDLMWLQQPRFISEFDVTADQESLPISWSGPRYEKYLLKFRWEGRERVHELVGRKFQWTLPQLAPGEKPKPVIVTLQGVTHDKIVSPPASAVVILKPPMNPKLVLQRPVGEVKVQFSKDGHLECAEPLRLNLSPALSAGRAEVVEQLENGEFFARPVAALATNFCPSFLGPVHLIYRIQAEGQAHWVESEKLTIRAIAGAPDIRWIAADNLSQVLVSGEQKHLGIEVEVKRAGKEVIRTKTETGRVDLHGLGFDVQVRARYVASLNVPVSDWTVWRPAPLNGPTLAQQCAAPDFKLSNSHSLVPIMGVVKPSTWLSWQAQAGAVSYEVELADNETFVGSSTHMTPMPKYFLELPTSQTVYFWRVRSLYSKDGPRGLWSLPGRFEVREVERRTSSLDVKPELTSATPKGP